MLSPSFSNTLILLVSASTSARSLFVRERILTRRSRQSSPRWASSPIRSNASFSPGRKKFLMRCTILLNLLTRDGTRCFFQESLEPFSGVEKGCCRNSQLTMRRSEAQQKYCVSDGKVENG